MSRFYNDDWDDSGPPPEFWQQTVRNAIRGRRGQAILRELREALLALPQPRLIEGSVVCEGEVCAIGALAAHRLRKAPLQFKGRYFPCGVDGLNLSFETMSELEDRLGERLSDEIATVELGQEMGLTRALAWAIGYENDEGTWKNETPEQRYQRVLAWIDRELMTTEAS